MNAGWRYLRSGHDSASLVEAVENAERRAGEYPVPDFAPLRGVMQDSLLTARTRTPNIPC